jgi:hypothetical protein
MNRSDLHRLTRLRVREARVLLREGQSSGAYYLLGYAVECALKTRIARRTRRGDFPDKKRVTDAHTHNLNELARLAGLDDGAASAADPTVARYWGTVRSWRSDARYETHTAARARDL